MKKIEKTTSRDLSLIDTVAWHEGFTKGLKAWLGWSYSDVVFYGHNGFTETWRAPEEHGQEFPNAIAARIDADPSWFAIERDKLVALDSEVTAFYQKSLTDLEIADQQTVVGIYLEYLEYIRKIMGPFIMMLWFPIWAEHDEGLAKRYPHEVEQAIVARKLTEKIFPGGAALTTKILERVSAWSGVPLHLVKFVSASECLDFLKQGTPLVASQLEARGHGYLYCNAGVLLTDNTSQDLVRLLASIGFIYEPVEIEEVSELRGQPACKGEARGRVRVILSKKDISTLEPGEVLVTGMTTPEYLPAMQKSVAFVTNEGGVTCHAAIIARELKKPCIIGTKFATQALHDGDLVEVDADAGVVRILERA